MQICTQQVRADNCEPASLLQILIAIVHPHHRTLRHDVGNEPGSTLHSDLRLSLQLNRRVKLLAKMDLDAGDSVVPADLAPLRSLGPGESEGLASGPPLLAGSGGWQRPLAPPDQHPKGQVGNPTIGASCCFVSCAARCHMADRYICLGRLCMQ